MSPRFTGRGRRDAAAPAAGDPDLSDPAARPDPAARRPQPQPQPEPQPEPPAPHGHGERLVGSTADPALLHHPTPPAQPGTAKPGTAPRPARRPRWLRRARHRLGRARHSAVTALSGPTALAVTIAVAVAGLLLAFYVTIAQINLTNCLAEYNEAASRATAARADAAAQDRALDLKLRALDAGDQQLDRADDAAAAAALAATGTGRQADAYAALRTRRAATAVQRGVNDRERADLARQRAAVEMRRKDNPLPAPPSQRCG